ncbi:MAG: hypothetical protein IJE05_02015 [Clostridia bacterium]|nr:hypothetical protein [Clostridia bacterium]
MKRAGNIYEKITQKENIRKAILSASKGKKRRTTVKDVIDNMDFYVCKIHNMLINKTYKPSPYSKLLIHDGTRKKERIIFKPKFYPDQIVHWALMNNIQPLLEKGMYDYTCASIPDRGIHYGAKHLKKILVADKKNTKYALKLDIKKFYPSIDKEIMKRKFRRIIKDRDTLDLIDLIVDSSEGGLPIRKLYFTMVC